MAINANIALQGKGVTLADPVERYSQMQQLIGAQNQNQLAQYQLGSAQRAEKSQNMLADAYSQATDQKTGAIDYNKVNSFLASSGGGAQIAGVNKSRFEQQKAQTDFDKGQVDLLDAKLKQSRSFLDTIDPSSPDAAQKYMAWHEANHRDPVIAKALEARGITADQARGSIQQAIQQGPQALAQMINQSKLGTEKFMEMNKPTLTSQNLGGVDQIMSTPGLGGQASVVPGSVGTVTSTPAQIQSDLTARRGQDMLDARSVKDANQRVTYQTDANGNIIALPSSLGVGAMPTAMQVTGAGGIPVKGKLSAGAEKAGLQQKQLNQDIGFAITELKDAYKNGGLIDQSTGSGAGRLIDLAAGFGGQATSGAIAIGKLQPIADLALKMVPRFEGPQSDKDVTSYRQAAGQLADPTLPTAIRKEAAKTVVRLMESRKNQFTTDAIQAGGGVAPASAGGGVDTSNPLLR